MKFMSFNVWKCALQSSWGWRKQKRHTICWWKRPRGTKRPPWTASWEEATWPCPKAATPTSSWLNTSVRPGWHELILECSLKVATVWVCLYTHTCSHVGYVGLGACILSRCPPWAAVELPLCYVFVIRPEEAAATFMQIPAAQRPFQPGVLRCSWIPECSPVQTPAVWSCSALEPGPVWSVKPPCFSCASSQRAEEEEAGQEEDEEWCLLCHHLKSFIMIAYYNTELFNWIVNYNNFGINLIKIM